MHSYYANANDGPYFQHNYFYYWDGAFKIQIYFQIIINILQLEYFLINFSQQPYSFIVLTQTDVWVSHLSKHMQAQLPGVQRNCNHYFH